MVRVAQLKHGAKLKTRQRKLETWKQLAASAPAADIAKTIVERATAWATAASQAEDAAMALYDMEIAIASTSSFELDRFIATADAVDASVAASTAAAKVNGDLVSLSYLTPRDKPLGNFQHLSTLLQSNELL